MDTFRSNLQWITHTKRLKKKKVNILLLLCTRGRAYDLSGWPQNAKLLKTLLTKTDRTHRKNLPTLKTRTDKTDKISEGAQLGLIATWSTEFGYVSLRDPTTGEWHDLKTTVAPEWAVGEARKRKELYKSGNRRAYRLTSSEIEELWRTESPVDEGVVGDFPLEEDEPG